MEDQKIIDILYDYRLKKKKFFFKNLYSKSKAINNQQRMKLRTDDMATLTSEENFNSKTPINSSITQISSLTISEAKDINEHIQPLNNKNTNNSISTTNFALKHNSKKCRNPSIIYNNQMSNHIKIDTEPKQSKKINSSLALSNKSNFLCDGAILQHRDTFVFNSITEEIKDISCLNNIVINNLVLNFYDIKFLESQIQDFLKAVIYI